MRPGQAGRPLSPRASPPRHQRHHQPRRVRPRVPRCSRPRAPGSNNEAERRDRGPGLRRRQPRGRRISISEAFLFVLLCSFSSPNAQHIPGRVLSSGATEAERGCPRLGRRTGRGPGGLRRTPASRPARPDILGDGPPGKKRLGREPGRDKLPRRICPERGPWSLQFRRGRTGSRDRSGLGSGLCHEIIWCPDLQARLCVPRFPHLKNEAEYISHRSKCF